jgi:hypothetical protein
MKTPGADFLYIFPGIIQHKILQKILRKIFPPKMLGKIAIFHKKIMKNHFFNKFHGIFNGKSLSMEKMLTELISILG